jgi:Tfp pilus assembly protein PilN
MGEIDLIPTDYRNRIWFQGKAKLFGTSIASMVAITAVIYTTVQFTNGKLHSKISELQKQQETTSQQHEVIKRFDKDIQNLEYQLVLLNSLRSGTGAPEMFTTIDRAMTDTDVWFDNWEYQRVGSPVEQNDPSSKNGNLFILPAGDGTTTDTAWEIETHMTIKGQAKDHSALSRFVRRLSNQPEIHNVKILNTTTATHINAIDFNIAVTVITGGENS